MQALFSILTAAILLVHASLGCAWHHGHACPAYKVAAKDDHHGETGHKCCHHGHHRHSQPADSPVAPCGCDLDCHQVCTYLPTSKILVDHSADMVSFEHVAILPTLATSQTHSAQAEAWFCDVHGFEPPLRLHLLHQILLI